MNSYTMQIYAEERYRDLLTQAATERRVRRTIAARRPDESDRPRWLPIRVVRALVRQLEWLAPAF